MKLIGYHSDLTGAPGIHIVSEGSRKKNVPDLSGLLSQFFRQNLYSCRNRSLGQLNLPHVLLCQIDLFAVCAVLASDEQKGRLSMNGDQSVLQPACQRILQVLRITKSAVIIDKAMADQKGKRVNQTGTTDADRLHISDDFQKKAIVRLPQMAYCTVCSPHAALNFRAFKGRSGSRRGRKHFFLISQNHLSIGPDVHHQSQLLQPVKGRRYHTANRIRSDKSRNIRKEQDNSLFLMNAVRASHVTADQEALSAVFIRQSLLFKLKYRDFPCLFPH